MYVRSQMGEVPVFSLVPLALPRSDGSFPLDEPSLAWTIGDLKLDLYAKEIGQIGVT